jgi:hypothetical protein
MDKKDLRIIDNADTVSHRLRIVNVLINSTEFDNLDIEDILVCRSLISDILDECIIMLTRDSYS